MGNARVVDQHRQRPRAAHLSNGLDAVLGGEIGHEWLDAHVHVRRLELIESALAAADGDQVKTVGGERLGVGLANPG